MSFVRNTNYPQQKSGGNSKYAHIKSGWYTVGGLTYFFRSKLEYEYAVYLESLKQKKAITSWELEPKTFEFKAIQHGITRYTPDFKVIKQDGTHYWVECKGVMDSASKTKIARFRKYFPNEELKVVMYSDFQRFKGHCKWQKSLLENAEEKRVEEKLSSETLVDGIVTQCKRLRTIFDEIEKHLSAFKEQLDDAEYQIISEVPAKEPKTVSETPSETPPLREPPFKCNRLIRIKDFVKNKHGISRTTVSKIVRHLEKTNQADLICYEKHFLGNEINDLRINTNNLMAYLKNGGKTALYRAMVKTLQQKQVFGWDEPSIRVSDMGKVQYGISASTIYRKEEELKRRGCFNRIFPLELNSSVFLTALKNGELDDCIAKTMKQSILDKL